jgi:hypothetical protein
MRRPSPALVVSFIALIVALGGTGYAATKVPRGSVGHAQLRPGAVQSDVVKDGALLARDFNRRDLPKGPKGDPGATIVVIRDTSGASTAPGQTGTATADCQGEERAVGGGGGFAGAANPGDRLAESRPSAGKDSGGGTPTRWTISIGNGDAAAARTPTAYVICASP